MTVGELIEELRGIPLDKLIVFRHTREDVPDSYETVDVYWEGDEAFFDIHSEDDDEN